MNEAISKRAGLRTTILAIVATLLAVSALALALTTLKPSAADAEISTITGQFEGPQQAAIEKAIQAEGFEPSQDERSVVTAPDACMATIYYYEYTDYEDPDAVMVEPGLRLLGTRTLTDLTEGQNLYAWDYVADIPGHFFFDGWPLNMTVTTDPSQNTFEFFYFKLYNYEYTVNYYMMIGADLQADNWTDALAPEGVTFEKLGSETITDQRFDMLVEGDAYEYKLDGMYVIDTYPAQIRLGADADSNVINVLYTPTSSTLPDDFEVFEVEETPDSGDEGTLPDDEVFDKDEIIDVIPGAGEDDTITGDFVGGDGDQILITDAMLENPVSQEQVTNMIDAYQTGREDATLPKTGDSLMPVILTLVGIVVAALVVTIVVISVRKRSGSK